MRARRLSCVLRGSALRAEHLRMRSTAIVLAMPVHPSCGHYDRVLHHNESLRMIPKSGVRFSDQDHAPRKKEAKRRKAQAVHCPHRSSRGRGRRSDPNGDRSPSGAPQRRLPRRANARTQPRPRFTRNTMRRCYLRLESRLSEAPRAPVIMPAGTMPGPPGSGVTSPARRNRTRSIVRELCI